MMIVIIFILKILYIIKINVLGIWEVDVIVKGMIVNLWFVFINKMYI